MPRAQVLFSGQGKLTLHIRDALGNPLGGYFIGNTPDLKITQSSDIEEHIESQTGSRLVDFRLQKSNKASISFSLEDFTKENIALGAYGTATTLGTGTVTAEALPSPVTVDDLYILQHQNVSSVVVKDSSGVPKTLASAQYVVNPKAGSLVIADKTTGAPYVEPFKLDYAYGAADQISMFTQPVPERWLRFEGVNTADGNNVVVVDLYRISLDPFSDLDLINSSINKFPVKGSVLVDFTKPSGGALGQFGRIIKI